MRDAFTYLAGAVLAVLAALLAVPPLIDWPAQRGWVDATLTRAIGLPVTTEGALDLRILPSPRVEARRMLIGPVGDGLSSLVLTTVKAQVGLTPLAGGEVRLRDARVGRAELRLPGGSGGEPALPRGFATEVLRRGGWAIEELSVGQLVVTSVDRGTGGTGQVRAEAVRVQASSLGGPWRVDGLWSGTPFGLAIGEIGADLAATLKASLGGGERPRIDLDGRIVLAPRPSGDLEPRFAGIARAAASLLGPGGGPALPIRAQASLSTAGRTVTLTEAAVEAGETATVRLTGEGGFAPGRGLSLSLAGRRVDLAAFWLAHGEAARAALESGAGRSPVPISLAIRLDSLAVGGDEDLSRAEASLSLAGGRLALEAFQAEGPGGSLLKASGEASLPAGAGRGRPAFSGRLSAAAREGDRLGRYAVSLGLPDLGPLLGPDSLAASADLAFAEPIVSLRNLRLASGEATLAGALRFTAAEGGARPRIDAQLTLGGLDVGALPRANPLVAAARPYDLNLTLDARNVAYGPARGGRIVGRLTTEGPAVVVDGLEVRGLAGAQANLSGRILPDGSGRIEGRLRSDRAAPLLDLFGPAWIGGLAKLVPPVLENGAVNLEVEIERAGGGTGPAALRTRLRGRLAGGPFEATTLAQDGLVTNLTARAGTDDLASWLGLDETGRIGRPATLEVSGERNGAGRLALRASGALAGLRVAADAIELGGGDGVLDRGELTWASADVSGLLPVFGLRAAERPLPAQGLLRLTRGEGLRAEGTGRIGTLDASIDLTATDALAGSVRLSRASLPWLAETLAVPAKTVAAGLTAAPLWSRERFEPLRPRALRASVTVAAAELELGAGLAGREARFVLATTPDGFRLSGLDLAFLGGRLRAAFSLERQGSLAALVGEGSVQDLLLGRFLGAPFGPGRLSGNIRFGASGESAAGLVSNLGGAGEVTLDDVAVAGADPGAVGRVAARLLRSDDPLAGARFGPLLAEELNRGPLAAARMTSGGTLVGGVLRLSPLRADTPGGSWQGAASFDLRTLSVDIRGSLQSAESPRGWAGAPPAIALGWSGPAGRPGRTVDPAPLANALASVVLARELDRIDTFELDAAEQRRRNSRVEMDRQRRLAAEEAARQARLKAEAEERARQEAERQRRETERRAQEGDRRVPPLEIRPPPAQPDPG